MKCFDCCSPVLLSPWLAPHSISGGDNDTNTCKRRSALMPARDKVAGGNRPFKPISSPSIKLVICVGQKSLCQCHYNAARPHTCTPSLLSPTMLRGLKEPLIGWAVHPSDRSIITVFSRRLAGGVKLGRRSFASSHGNCSESNRIWRFEDLLDFFSKFLFWKFY